MSINLDNYLRDRRELIERYLDKVLPSESRYPEKLHQALRYSVFSGGKRIRPILLLGSYEIFRDDIEKALPFACALEMIHCYSLIHDDLPAMDDDDFRRGKATCHKVFGEATAILAGDALLTEAFGLMARSGLEFGFGEKCLEAIQEFANAAGLNGIIAGQEVDLEKQGMRYDDRDLEFISRRKTGALIKASVLVGGMLGGASESELTALSEFGLRVGLAFQIKDDILDFGGVDKGDIVQNSDARKSKATYPGFFGLNQSMALARKYSEEAREYLSIFSERADALRQIAEWLVCREY